MSSQPQQSEMETSKGQWFTTTHWTVVLAAGRNDSPEADAALNRLCRAYWYPLYAYVRRLGHAHEDAQDLTQQFFTRLLEKNFLDSVHPDKGKFRSFLLGAMNHFLSNERDRRQAIKRGGDRTFIPLEPDDAEGRYQLESPASLSPAMLFERRWAMTILEQGLERLRLEFKESGRGEQFDLLKGFLEGEVGRGDYHAAAAALNVKPGSVAMAVHRLRRRYQDLVRAEVASTVAESGELEEEMRHLFTVLAQ